MWHIQVYCCKTRDSGTCLLKYPQKGRGFSIVTDFTDEPLQPQRLQLYTCEVANLMTLPKNGASFPSITCRKRNRNREESKFVENKVCRCRTGIPFLYTTGKPLIIISQQLWERQDIVFTRKELSGLNHWGWKMKMLETSFVLLFFCSVL